MQALPFVLPFDVPKGLEEIERQGCTTFRPMIDYFKSYYIGIHFL